MTSFFSTPQNLSSTPLNIRETSLSPVPKIYSVLAWAPTAGAKDGDGGGGGKMLATNAISGDGEEDTRNQDALAALLQLLVPYERSETKRGVMEEDSRAEQMWWQKQMHHSELERERGRNGGKGK